MPPETAETSETQEEQTDASSAEAGSDASKPEASEESELAVTSIEDADKGEDKGSAERKEEESSKPAPDGEPEPQAAGEQDGLAQQFETMRADNVALRKQLGGIESLMGRFGDRLGAVDKMEQEKIAREATAKADQDFEEAFSEENLLEVFNNDPRAFAGRLRDAINSHLMQSPEVTGFGSRLGVIEQRFQENDARRQFNGYLAQKMPDRAGNSAFLNAAWESLLDLQKAGKTEGRSTEELEADILKMAEARLDGTASMKPAAPAPKVAGAKPALRPEDEKPKDQWEADIKDHEDRLGAHR
jgi:hypothetical protein